MRPRHLERHRTERIGWLRAAVLGANDGIVSTASLVLGVAAAHATHSNILVAGVAGLVAGAMSMAAGEYVSVHSQADTEKADIELERKELKMDDAGEHRELAAVYVRRGLDPALAKQVADQLMAHDGLGAHVRDELGISQALSARPNSGCLCFGRQLRYWSSHAPFGHVIGPRGKPDLPRFRYFTGFPRAPGWGGCARRWSTLDGGRNACHVLGCTGNGVDRWRRRSVWSGCVSEAAVCHNNKIFNSDALTRTGEVHRASRTCALTSATLVLPFRRPAANRPAGSGRPTRSPQRTTCL